MVDKGTEVESVHVSSLVEIFKRLKYLGEAVQRLDDAIRGNGKPGLRQEQEATRAELRALQTALTNCQARRDLERQNADRWWARLVQPGVVLVYGGLAVLIMAGAVAWIGRNVQTDVREQVRQVLIEEQHAP